MQSTVHTVPAMPSAALIHREQNTVMINLGKKQRCSRKLNNDAEKVKGASELNARYAEHSPHGVYNAQRRSDTQ